MQTCPCLQLRTAVRRSIVVISSTQFCAQRCTWAELLMHTLASMGIHLVHAEWAACQGTWSAAANSQTRCARGLSPPFARSGRPRVAGPQPGPLCTHTHTGLMCRRASMHGMTVRSERMPYMPVAARKLLLHACGLLLARLVSHLDGCMQVCRSSPGEKGKYIKIILALLQSSSTAVVYECAVTLVSLSQAPSAIRAAANCFCQLLVSQSDNNVKLIVLDRLTELKNKHREVMQVRVGGLMRCGVTACGLNWQGHGETDEVRACGGRSNEVMWGRAGAQVKPGTGAAWGIQLSVYVRSL